MGSEADEQKCGRITTAGLIEPTAATTLPCSREGILYILPPRRALLAIPSYSMMRRRYPIGIQTFSRIIREGYVYVDKTDLVWNLTKVAPFVFLSRPRRFGKSLLSTTLESYFLGEKELFEGLKIMEMEKEWKQYPVIHLDLSTTKGQSSAEELRSTLMWVMDPLVKQYGTTPNEFTPGKLLAGLIQRASEKTGAQVAVIIDEYDAPLLEVLHKGEELEEMRRVMQEFYVQLKANERYLKFCFITGITKFSQLSIFSTLNNLKNVSLMPAFSAICGITEEEVKTCFREDVAAMATEYDCSADEMFDKLKEKYDGYHFSSSPVGVYNPFSLLNALDEKEMKNFWFSTGTPSYLIRQLEHFHTDITSMEHMEVASSAFDQPTENMQDALPLLYQSGYITIKDYERESQMYTLSIPNQEVRVGFVDGLLPSYTGVTGSTVQSGFALKFWRALKKNDMEAALTEMQSYLAGLPYVEGFKKKLADVSNAEGFYEWTFYLIFSMLNVYVRTQVKCAGGRIDMVVHMPSTTYVMELKLNGSARDALSQIDAKGYAIPYKTTGKDVVKVGLSFSTESKTLTDWVITR